jgi:hypothetical protein
MKFADIARVGMNSARIPRATAGSEWDVGESTDWSEWNERKEGGSPEGAEQYQFISASGPKSSRGSTE